MASPAACVPRCTQVRASPFGAGHRSATPGRVVGLSAILRFWPFRPKQNKNAIRLVPDGVAICTTDSLICRSMCLGGCALGANSHSVERAVDEEERNQEEHNRQQIGQIAPALVSVNFTANSTASNPNSVVNLITGFKATDEVSLKGSPTVSPITVASCSGVPFCFDSTSTIFLALSHAPPAFAMKIAWYKPKIAIEIKYPMKKNGSTKAKA